MKKKIYAVLLLILAVAGALLAKNFAFDRSEPATALDDSVVMSMSEALSIYEQQSTELEITEESSTSMRHYTYADTKTTQRKTTAAATQKSSGIREDGYYYSKDDVALYIHTYGRLPSNFITKKQAQSLGWEGGSVERYAPGKAIGGDYYGNYEGKLLPGSYHECDINTKGKSVRGAERLVYSTEGVIYYTPDHYETFIRLY